MKINNPVFTEAEKIFNEAPVRDARAVQYPDILTRFAGLAVLVIIGAAAGWTVLYPILAGLGNVAYIALILGLVAVAYIAIRAFRDGKTTLGVSIAVCYALTQGAIIGFISRVYNDIFGDGIIGQAVLATAVTVAVVIAYSATPLGKRTGKATRVFTITIIAYLLFSLISIGLGVFTGLGGGWGIWGMGAIGIIACLAGVTFASWSVNIDIATINNIVESGQPMPKGTDWMLAFGLTVSILWLYFELLRLIGMSRR